MKLDQQMIKVVHALCNDVATPRSALVKELATKGDWIQLQKLKCNPADYSNSFDYWRDAIVTDLFRKVEVTENDKSLEQAAVDTFFACEATNTLTNHRLSRFLPDSCYFEHGQDLSLSVFIDEWRAEVKRILGRLPDDLTINFGGGATMSDEGKLTTIPDKLSKQPSVTIDCLSYRSFYDDSAWGRGLRSSERAWEPQVVPGNKFFTVPKDAVKHRGCCKEPSLNVAYQLCVGKLLKARLKTHGVDLKGGQQKHRRLARRASINGSLATVDLSNASDTVSRVLVELVLPPDWYQLLDDLRSKKTFIKGRWHRLEKFSSMGNGFTFELETLIFYTLAKTICKRLFVDYADLTVYGDDIICPVEAVDSLLASLRFFGFTPNASKTFVNGSFRESCGGDFFLGDAVRSHYVKKLPSEPACWISLANGLRRLCSHSFDNDLRWTIVKRAWFLCLRAIPSDIRRCRGPHFLGDVVIHDETFDCRVDTNGTPYVKAWVPIPVVLQWDYWLPPVQLASALKDVPSSGVSPRGSVKGYRFNYIPVWGVATTA